MKEQMIERHDYFKPLFFTNYNVTMSTYQELSNKYETSPYDLKAINDLINILQNYIFSPKNNWETFADDKAVFENKKYAVLRVMDIATSIKDNYALYMDYLAIMAQNSVIVGDLDLAISYYYELLFEDGVLNATYDESYYAGELELAAKIIHNICALYSLELKLDNWSTLQLHEGQKCEKASLFQRVCCFFHLSDFVHSSFQKLHQEVPPKVASIIKKYKYIFELEFQRTKRLQKKNPELKESFERDFCTLYNFNEGILYYDSTYADWYIFGNLMEAICADSKRSGLKHQPDLSRTVKIKKDKSGVFVFDTDTNRVITEIQPI